METITNYFEEYDLPNRHYDYDKFTEILQKHIDYGNLRLDGIGRSFEGREIKVLLFGHGPHTVLIWSQMHGNEPTSTLALMDVLNYLDSELSEVSLLAQKLTIVIVPLLNPDGHIINDRRNAQGIDINRDAINLTSPEAKLLMQIAYKFQPEFAFNLHDQEAYYTSGKNHRQTLLALLAPESDKHNTITPIRENSMKLIADVAHSVQSIVEGRIGRYDDKFTPSAFGDALMWLGTSSMLIEAGASPNDPERKEARKIMYNAILIALLSISKKSYLHKTVFQYNLLPINIRDNAFDLKISGLTVRSLNHEYKIDVGIKRVKTSFNVEDFAEDFQEIRITNLGDLSSHGAIKEFDANGYILNGNHTTLRIGNTPNFSFYNSEKSIEVSTLLNVN